MAKYGISDALGINDLPKAIVEWLEQCQTSGLTATREMKFEAANKAGLREVVEKKFESKQKAKEKKQPKQDAKTYCLNTIKELFTVISPIELKDKIDALKNEVMAEKQTKDISERLDSGKLSIEALEALLRQRKMQQ